MSKGRSSASTVRGWGCTPTDSTPHEVVAPDDQTQPRCLPKKLSRGWRRTALYGILVFLMLLIFLNIALTLWIISTLRLTMKGIGPIKIVKGGIQLDGQAWIVDNLVASTITPRFAQPITLHSYRNFTILVSETDQLEYAKLLIKRDNIECSGRVFKVNDARGGSIFHASRDEVRVYADVLAINGVGGVTVRGALQVPFVQAPPGSDLQLESLTRKLDLRAPQSIHLESRAGNIDVTSHSDIKLNSMFGAIKIDAQNIVIDNLKEAIVTEMSEKIKKVRTVKVYQLCACASGKLFLAAPDALCAAHNSDDDLCR